MSWEGSRRTAAGLLVLVAPLALGTFVPQNAAGAAVRGSILAPGRVVPVTPPIGAAVPSDGRLRGAEFLARVTGVAWPAAVRGPAGTLVAPGGDRLVVFTVHLSIPEHAFTLLTMKTPQSTLELGSRALPVPLASMRSQLAAHSTGGFATGTATFGASVPASDHAVALTMAEDGLAQRFDLWTLRRLAPAPGVLYRSPASPEVTASAPAARRISISAPGTAVTTEVSVSFMTATLSEWPPATLGVRSLRPTQAYLWVRLLAQFPGEDTLGPTGHYFSEIQPLPASHVTFTPTGLPPIAATSEPVTRGLTTPVNDDGLFDAQDVFVVPDSTTSGTLSLTPATVTGQMCTGAGCGTAPQALRTTATAFPLSFPDPLAPRPPQPRPRWIGAPLPPTGLSALGETGAGAGTHSPPGAPGGFPVWAAVVVLAALCGAAVATERSLRWRRRARAAGVATTIDSEDGDNSPADPGTPAPQPRRDPPAGFSPVTPPPLGTPGDLVVRVLGPVEVTGWTPPDERRQILEELCCFLALHPGRVFGSADLLAAMWPVDGERREAVPKTIHNQLSLLRRAVGPGHLPDAPGAGGYRLAGVVTDWAEASRLLALAAAAQPEEADALRERALAHVRGRPFEGAKGAQYAWTRSGQLASEMAVALTGAAHRLSLDRLEAADPAGAGHAARSGLRATPDDDRLWLDAFVAAKALGDPATVARVVRDAAASIGAARVTSLRATAGL